MKPFLSLLLSINSIITFAQSDNLKIVTSNSDTVFTQWVVLESSPLSKKPYLRINSNSGSKLSIDQIKLMEGADQNGHFNLLKVNSQDKNIQFTHWKHSEEISGNLTLSENQLLFGSHSWPPDRKLLEYYAYNSNDFQKLTFRNVKADLKNKGIKSRQLTQAKALIVLQRVSQIIGISLLTAHIIDKTPKIGADFFNNPNDNVFYISTSLIVLPITLNGVKRNLLKDSLRNAFSD